MYTRRGSEYRYSRQTVGKSIERVSEGVEPLARARRHRHRLGARKQRRRLLQRRAGIGEVGLRDRDDARAHAELASTAACSRVCGITPSSAATTTGQVDARRARDHRAHEPLVARDVDHRQLPPARQRQRRVAELDRDPALALLGQPVGVDCR